MAIDASRLQVSLEEGERWRRTLSITVPADLVQAERNEALKKLSSQMKLKGFRTGKVPASVVEKRFGPVVDQELVDRVIGEAYRSALREKELNPISRGEVGKVDYEPRSDLSFSISFEVAPQVELARVGGFQVTRPAQEIGDEEVDRVIERLREQHGTWRPREEGTPQEGDLVSVFITRLAEDDGEPRRYEFTLGKGEAIPDVEKAIGTLEVGGEGRFTITFPADFPNEERRGDSDELHIRLESRKELEPPPLDDLPDLVGEFDSIESLRARIREDLEAEASEEAEGAVRGQLLEQVLAANAFEVPEAMVDQYIRSVLGDKEELDEERMVEAREQFGAHAERAVKQFLVIDEIARSRELEATEEELDARIEEIAERSGTTPSEVYARLQRSGALERIGREITERKVFDFLKSESTIVDAS